MWRRGGLAVCALLAAAVPARADYDVGLAAYHNGNLGAARSEFEAVADVDARAMVALGIMAARGEGIERDAALAAQWFERAAAAGNAAGQYQLARLYHAGIGLAADKARAAELFDLAGQQGHVRALHALSLMLEAGDGVPADPARAFALTRVNAEAGVPDDQFRVARMYAEGRGTDADPAEGYYWMTLAAQTGLPAAVEALDALAAKLTPEQRQEQHLRAAAWVPHSKTDR